MSNKQSVNKAAQREPVEVVYAAELDKLRSMDHGPVPPGWQMSPRAVEKFVMGDEKLGIERKFVADRAMVVRIIISLCTSRGCLLVGEPGYRQILVVGVAGRRHFGKLHVNLAGWGGEQRRATAV